MSMHEDPAITGDELDHYRTFISRVSLERQVLDRETLRRFEAAIGGDPEALPATIPPLRHWAYFLPVAVRSQLGEDGHPVRGGLLPPVRLPRRMFASGTCRFEKPLASGEPAELSARLVDVQLRRGKTGCLVFAEVERIVRQREETCISETQTIVYRGIGDAVPAVQPMIKPSKAGGVDDTWTPTPVDLFRFSAVTFNAHRIHYDQAYARDVERYPDLVVHGPFTAVRLCLLAQHRAKQPLKAFQFRAVAPLFVSQAVLLTAETAGSECTLRAVRDDGAVAMTATARF